MWILNISTKRLSRAEVTSLARSMDVMWIVRFILSLSLFEFTNTILFHNSYCIVHDLVCSWLRFFKHFEDVQFSKMCLSMMWYLISVGLGFQSSRLDVALSIINQIVSDFKLVSQKRSARSVESVARFILHPSPRPIGRHKPALSQWQCRQPYCALISCSVLRIKIFRRAG